MDRLLVCLLLAGCGSSSQCTTTACAAGSYQYCQSGGSCAYQLSDGRVLPCDCGSCGAQAVQVASWCGGAAPDMGAPDLAQATTGTIPKTGAPYTGAHTDPGLTDESFCPDATIEPNDDLTTALNAPTPAADLPTPKITKMAICPEGPSPLTGAHDVDWFKVVAPSASGLSLLVELFYDITRGDLDLAITDESGHIIASDGSAVANACLAAPWTGVRYVMVVGANNLEVNTYELSIRAFSTPHACP